jgi:hypothetical protein
MSIRVVTGRFFSGLTLRLDRAKSLDSNTTLTPRSKRAIPEKRPTRKSATNSTLGWLFEGILPA